jgi:hypothetical protein
LLAVLQRRQLREHIPPHTCPDFGREVSRSIELLQHLLDLGVLLFDGHQRLLDLVQAFLLVGLVRRAGLVLLLSEVLDLLTAVLYFCEAQRRRGAFQEVAER